MKPYFTNPHAVILYIVALIVIGYGAAYPYLNPQNLQWENAVIYGSMAVISAVVLGHGHVSTQLKFVHVVDALSRGDSEGPPTRPVPTIDNPDNYRD